MEPTEEQFDRLIHALTKISHGTIETVEPTGLEALTMALSGDSISGRDSLGKQVKEGLNAVADSIDRLADAIAGRK